MLFISRRRNRRKIEAAEVRPIPRGQENRSGCFKHTPLNILANGWGFVFLIAAALSGLLVWQSEQYSLHEKQVRVALVAGEYAHDVEYTIMRALTAAHSLAALVRQGNGSVPNFDAITHKLLPLYPGASELALAPSIIIRKVAPMSGNEKAIGLDLLTAPAERKESLLARDSGNFTLAGPLELAQGGTGVIGRLPVFLEDRRGTMLSNNISCLPVLDDNDTLVGVLSWRDILRFLVNLKK